MLGSASFALAVAVLANGSAADPLDYVPPPPPTFPGDGVTVDERLATTLPLDTPLRDHAGRDVTLGELLAGDMPTILTFNYSSCPNLCSLQLTSLSGVLPELVWKVGRQYRILTIVLDPDEPADRVRATRARYLERLPAGSDAAGWTFATTRIPGDEAPIRRIADAVGFRYKFLADRGEWAHPAALIFVSPAGRVTRYIHGAVYDKAALTESIARAGTDEPSAALGFLARCFHWNPGDKDHSQVGVAVLRLGAAIFVVLALAAFGTWQLVRRQRRPAPRGFGERQ